MCNGRTAVNSPCSCFWYEPGTRRQVPSMCWNTLPDAFAAFSKVLGEDAGVRIMSASGECIIHYRSCAPHIQLLHLGEL